jgi:hypothetical protein
MKRSVQSRQRKDVGLKSIGSLVDMRSSGWSAYKKLEYLDNHKITELVGNDVTMARNKRYACVNGSQITGFCGSNTLGNGRTQRLARSFGQDSAFMIQGAFR